VVCGYIKVLVVRQTAHRLREQTRRNRSYQAEEEERDRGP
jgi:hypothetical protein